ncbi:DNRLRE domain-containing protein [Streptomyces sp. NPDC057565]|uniref:DNRLRE domain-containing protein n=1 Tax=Streptomyces sp. NPDC057565 TaxID=3346169 RepID=UPI00369A9012
MTALAVAVGLTGAVVATPAAADGGAQAGVTVADDLLAARVAARLSGHRVEAAAERSETATTWVNSDGSLTTEITAGPTRFQKDGKWLPVDLDLVADASGVRPQGHPRGLTLARGGLQGEPSLAAAQKSAGRDLVTLGSGGDRVSLQWKGVLPTPTLEGRTATYRDAFPGADLVVSATRTGFEQYVVLRERPEAGFSYTLPLSSPGLKVRQAAGGSVEFTDARSAVRAVMPAPVMWDEQVDARSGDRVNRARVAMKVVARKGGADLVLTPDADYLAASATQYPVTIDPSTTALAGLFDTYVQQGETTDLSGDVELDWGNPGTTNADGTPRTARSFVTWKTAPLADAVVSSAKLSLFNFHSANTDCLAYPWEVWSTTTASTSSRWTAQPTWGTKYATSTETKGNAACTADGWINADVTSLAQSWATAAADTSTLGLRASSETVVAQWKRVNSAQAASNPPKLTVTYNQRPRAGTKQEAGPPFFSYSGAYTVSTTTPTLRDTFVDPNGDKVTGTFQVYNSAGTTQIGSNIVSTAVASGSAASVKVPSGLLTNGTTYTFRTIAGDGALTGSTWSAWKSFTVDTTAPFAPASVTSTDYPSSSWVKGAGQAGSFTVTPPAGTDHNWIEWSLDGATWTKIATGGASTAKTFSVTPATNGTHVLAVRSVDKADNRSEEIEYTFHAGAGGIISPDPGTRTPRRLLLQAEADATKYTSVAFSWRRSAADGWVAIPPGDVTSGGTPLTTWPVAAPSGKNAPLVWNASDTVNPDGAIEIKADFTATGYPTQATPAQIAVVDRAASGAATTSVGPGQVNLLTGEFSLDATDASAFGLTVTRSAASRHPDARTQGQAPIFGKEWTTGIAAETTGASDTHIRRVTDTALDLVDSDGSSIHFTANAAATGWIPEPGYEHLTLTGSVATSFTLADTDGTVSTYVKPTSATTWQLATTLLDGLTNSTATVQTETVVSGPSTLARPKRLIATTTAATAATCAATPSTKGCRTLEFVYATSTTATSSALGDYTGQVKELRLWATAPGAATATSRTVAAYSYDTSGRLCETWNPQITPALTTAYSYDTDGRVLTLTPPGLLPWTFTYGTAGTSTAAGPGMLLTASRPTLQAGTSSTVSGTATTSVVYDVPLTGSSAPRSMDAGDVSDWGQRTAPTDATALFPADATPASHVGTSLTSGSYGRATVTYLDASGRTLNTAEPGGHMNAVGYDRFGNTIRELTSANRALSIGVTAEQQAVLADLGIESLDSADRADLLATNNYFDSTGTRLLEAFGPLHRVDLTADLKDGTTVLIPAGTSVPAQSWTVNEYDTGRPTNGTAVIRDALTLANVGARVRGYDSLMTDKRLTEIQYDWGLGLPNLTIADTGGLNINTSADYDTQGRVIAASLPGSTGSDAATTITQYWTATGTGWCQGRPEWADLPCWTGPAGAITGGGSNPTHRVDTTTEYDYYGSVAQTTETSDDTTRMTFYTYDAAGRLVNYSMTDGLGTAVPEQDTYYDPATGLVEETSSWNTASAGAIYRDYDALGRPTNYTDASGSTTTTTYDNLDRTVTITDGVPSTTTYTYNHSTEPRGLPTTITDSVAGAFTATYDPDGRTTQQALPGGYTARTQYDTTGAALARLYTRDSDGTTVYSDTATYSAHSQVTRHTGWTTQEFTYDAVGRLTRTDDTAQTECTRRTYTLDQRSNRTAQTTGTAASGAACSTAPQPSTTHTYDTADRITDTGYTYDDLGRTLTVPGHGSIDYYANDLVRRQTNGTTRQTWTLDAAFRHQSWTVETSDGTTWTTTAGKTNHYADDSDTPRWISEDTATGALTRNVDGLDGSLTAITAKTGGTVLQLANLHGDIALQLPADTTLAPTVLDYDEYGHPRAGQASARYAWLGGAQRSDDTPSGLLLMGVRLSNADTGRFLTVDPVPGGSANAYEYCNGDPVNCYDLDGRMAGAFVVAAAGLGLSEVLIVLGAAFVIALAGYALWYGVSAAVHKLQVAFAHRKKDETHKTQKNRKGHRKGKSKSTSDKHNKGDRHGGRKKFDNPNKRNR